MTKEVKEMKGYELTQAGEVSDTVVSKIEEGVISDFIPKDKLQFSEGEEDREERATQPAVQVSTANGARKIIALPRGSNQLHPKSSLALWHKTYKAYPFVGQKVQTETDDKMFQRIVLKQR
jgi:hypothetical protein